MISVWFIRATITTSNKRVEACTSRTYFSDASISGVNNIRLGQVQGFRLTQHWFEYFI
jgi:hypothetical protein